MIVRRVDLDLEALAPTGLPGEVLTCLQRCIAAATLSSQAWMVASPGKNDWDRFDYSPLYKA